MLEAESASLYVSPQWLKCHEVRQMGKMGKTQKDTVLKAELEDSLKKRVSNFL
jgi:hypothetical protein